LNPRRLTSVQRAKHPHPRRAIFAETARSVSLYPTLQPPRKITPNKGGNIAKKVKKIIFST
jgi:hypothetical protein